MAVGPLIVPALVLESPQLIIALYSAFAAVRNDTREQARLHLRRRTT